MLNIRVRVKYSCKVFVLIEHAFKHVLRVRKIIRVLFNFRTLWRVGIFFNNENFLFFHSMTGSSAGRRV